MTLDLMPAKPRSHWLRATLFLAAGLAVGMPSGFFVGRLLKSVARTNRLGAADFVSLVFAVALTAMGLIVLSFSLTRRGAAYLADPHAAEPDRAVMAPQRRYFQAQGAVLALAGLMLATPVLFTAARPDLGEAVGPAVMLGLIAAFAVQTALNILIWNRSDELVRRAISDAGAISFWVLQGALFLWAAGEKLTVLPSLTSWTAVTVLMGFYLVMSVVVGYRRGLNSPLERYS